MDYIDEIDLLNDQLREKDKQIAELQQIICNLTEVKKDDTGCIEESDQKISFWERHIKLSYAVLCFFVVLSIIVIISPVLWPSLWDDQIPLTYMYSALCPIGFGLIAWLYTPRGRKWLKHL